MSGEFIIEKESKIIQAEFFNPEKIIISQINYEHTYAYVITNLFINFYIPR